MVAFIIKHTHTHIYIYIYIYIYIHRLLCLTIVVRFLCKLNKCALAEQTLILNMCVKCWSKRINIARIIAGSLCNAGHFNCLHIIMWTADDSYKRVYNYHRVFTVKNWRQYIIVQAVSTLPFVVSGGNIIKNCYGSFLCMKVSACLGRLRINIYQASGTS